MRIGAEDMLRTMSHDQATVAEEEYLQTIFWLQEAGLPMTGANVARAMQLSAPTVHEMIGRLERDGYITRAADKAISFTDSGREHAEGIVRRHRLREDVPARPPDHAGHAHRGRPARRRRAGREGHDPALRERGRGPAAR